MGLLAIVVATLISPLCGLFVAYWVFCRMNSEHGECSPIESESDKSYRLFGYRKLSDEDRLIARYHRRQRNK